MKKNFGRKTFICLFISLLLILPSVVKAQNQKIRVVVENSSIRVKPDNQSEVIKEPPIGTVFDVKRKVGEWYEIRVPTEVGVQVTGYIHEMFIEVMEEEKKPKEPEKEPEKEVPEKPEKKPLPPPTLKAPESPTTHGEIVIRGAYTTGYTTNDQSYTDSFSQGILDSATSTGRVTSELEKPLGFDGAFNYFLIGGLGIQLRFDYNLKSNFTDASKSTFELNWTWGSGGSYTEQEEWLVEGDVTLMIISGNLIYKVKDAGMFAPFFSGGASYYSGKLKANTTGAYATTWVISPYRYIDYFDLPAHLDTSFSGIGFNGGGGIDILFSDNVGLTIDARYFVLKKVEEKWQISPGTYNSNISTGFTLTINQEEADYLEEGINPFELSTSFFKVSAGLKFMF